MHSVYDEVKILASLVPAVRTASANGSGVDTMGYQSAMAIVTAGDLDLASGNETYAFAVEESSDNSTFVAISGATTTATADNDVKVIRIDGLGEGRLRYLRVVATLGGTTPSWPGSATFALGRAFQNPVN